MGGDLFGIGLGEIIFLAILALVIFGPRRLPEIARSVGRFLNQARQATSEFDRELRSWVEDTEAVVGWNERPASPQQLAAPRPPARPEADLHPEPSADQAPVTDEPPSPMPG